MTARPLSLFLCLVLFGCGGAPDAPEPSATSTPEPSPSPTSAPLSKDPLPASGLPWAVAVSEGPVIGCRIDGEYVPASKCPDRVFGVHVETEFAESPVVLTTGETAIGPSPDEACPDYRSLVELPSVESRLGRRGRRLDAAAPEVAAWLTPLLRGGLKVKALRSIDLDGDGTEEQIFELDTHPDMHQITGPASVASVVGVRSVATDGTASIVELYRSEGSIAVGEATEVAYGRGSVLGVTDVEGDGALEILVTGGRVQSMEWVLHSIAGGGAAELFRLECHWG